MELFGHDLVIGDFKLSDYGLILGSFDAGASDTEDELGMDHEVIEEFIGHNPVPIYLGAQYTEKLRPQITIIKDPCVYTDLQFTEHECREVLRQLTGFKTYKLMQLYSDTFDELIYFYVRTQSASYKKVNGRVVGIILVMECDSQFAWSKEYEDTYTVKAGESFTFYNASDDLYNYLLPVITITSSTAIPQLQLTNLNDNNWTTIINQLSANEIITMDCKNELLTSSQEGRLVLNDFNMHFIRFVSGRNQIQSNADVVVTVKCRVPRKVGFV